MLPAHSSVIATSKLHATQPVAFNYCLSYIYRAQAPSSRDLEIVATASLQVDLLPSHSPSSVLRCRSKRLF